MDIEGAAQREEIRFNVTGMTCATCSGAIEAGVGRHAGVSKVAVNLTTGVAVVTIDPAVIPRAEEIAAVIKRMGFGATVRAEGEVEDVDALDKKHAQESLGYLIPFIVSLIFTVPLVTLAMGLMKIPSVHMLLMKPLWKDATSTGPDWAATIMFLLATPVQFGPYMGLSFYIHAVQEILRCRLGMNFLIAAGTSAAYFYSLFAMVFGVATGEKVGSSHFFETSAMLITFVLLGKFLESFAKARTSRALSKLMKMQPQVATVLLEDGLEMEVPIADVVVGDTLKVVPGSKVPCDGVVLSGTASIDKVMISGEPIPVVVGVEDAVIGGTICVDGMLTIRVTKSAADSTLSQIIALVEDAQLSKAPIQSVADCISSIFAPVVAVFSLITFLIWLTLGLAGAVPVEWMPHNGGATLFALLFGISVMVIACPCALGLATPTAVMVGTGVGARYGVLIKGGEALQAGAGVKIVVFDKTGTLTRGKPAVTDFVFLLDDNSGATDASESESAAAATLTEDQIVWLAGCAESASEHPLARAVVEYATETLGLRDDTGDDAGEEEDADASRAAPLHLPLEFKSVPGRGLRSVVSRTPPAEEEAEGTAEAEGGEEEKEEEQWEVLVGNEAWQRESNVALSARALELMSSISKKGRTAVIISISGVARAVVGMVDPVKPEAAVVVKALRAKKIEVWMITGDNSATAAAIARDVGIDPACICAEVMPSGKAEEVIRLQAKKRGGVAMIGDGINDAPALAQADVGIAIGSGTEIAAEAADMVLMRDSLGGVLIALDLSRTVLNRIYLNFVWALGYNSVCIPVAAGLFFPLIKTQLPPAAAGAAMALSSVSVVCSSLLLLCYKMPAAARSANLVAAAESAHMRARRLAGNEKAAEAALAAAKSAALDKALDGIAEEDGKAGLRTALLTSSAINSGCEMELVPGADCSCHPKACICLACTNPDHDVHANLTRIVAALEATKVAGVDTASADSMYVAPDEVEMKENPMVVTRVGAGSLRQSCGSAAGGKCACDADKCTCVGCPTHDAKANLLSVVTILLSETTVKKVGADVGAASTTVAIAVEGMTCGACSATVTAVLSGVPGVESVEVSLITNVAIASFDAEATNPAALCGLIEAVGFGATVLNPLDAGGAEIAVDGMTCGSCSSTVESVLRSVPGVASVSVDLATNVATVKWSVSNATGSETNAAALCGLIEAVGFGATVLGTETEEEAREE